MFMSEAMRLLIAYDGSTYADAALDDLRRAGLADDAEALVICVVEDFLIPPESLEDVGPIPARSRRVLSALAAAQARSRQTLIEAESKINEAVSRLRADFPVWQVRTEIPQGAAAEAILRRAEEWKADLIVVGTQGRSALGRLILGSVSQKIVTDARTSVRIGRVVTPERVKPDTAPVCLVVAVDGSLGSEAAVRAVARRRWTEGSEAHVVAADSRVSPTTLAATVSTATETITENNEAEFTKMLAGVKAAAEMLHDAGLKVSTMVKEGEAQRVLLEATESLKADCLFVGSRGLSSWLERWRFGSVAAGVAPRAACSIEVVREREQGAAT